MNENGSRVVKVQLDGTVFDVKVNVVKRSGGVVFVVIEANAEAFVGMTLVPVASGWNQDDVNKKPVNVREMENNGSLVPERNSKVARRKQPKQSGGF